jgi:hypothetical protein
MTTSCGAGTRARRAGLHPGARPSVVPRTRDNSGFDRVVLDVPRDLLELSIVPDPVVIRFTLPEGLTGATENLVGRAGGHTFQSAEQKRRGSFGEDQRVNMVAHQNPGTEFVVPAFNPLIQRCDYQVRDRFQAQIHRPLLSGIEIPVNPDKRLSSREFSRRRISRLRKTPVQMPCGKEPFSFGKDVRQAAAVFGHKYVVAQVPGDSQNEAMRRDESRRGGHECPRHRAVKR